MIVGRVNRVKTLFYAQLELLHLLFLRVLGGEIVYIVYISYNISFFSEFLLMVAQSQEEIQIPQVAK